jgi:hypothetical protein
VGSDPVQSPPVGWAVGGSPDRRSSPAKKWLKLKNLLILLLVAWNGYFVAAVIYGATVHSPSRNDVVAIILWIWLLGDAAILVCSLALRSICKRRSTA